MIDIVIPYHLMNDGAELRYCLRSVEKHLKNYGNVFIIGDKPQWLSADAYHTPLHDQDMMKQRERNIYIKTMMAVTDPRVSDDFLFMNDDHFLLADYQAELFPYYVFRSIADVKTNNRPYQETLNNTIAVTGPGVPYLDGHCPIIYNKSLYKAGVGRLDWDKPWGYCIKTVYGAWAFPIYEEGHDTKFERPQDVTGLKYFSTADRFITREGLAWLEELYPQKSRYEL